MKRRSSLLVVPFFTLLLAGCGGNVSLDGCTEPCSASDTSDAGAATCDAPSGLQVLAPNQGIPLGVAVDETSIYWARDMGDMSNDGAGSGVFKMSLDGGAVTTLGHGVQVGPIALDSTSVYWTCNSYSSVGVVMKVDKDGGTPVTLATASGVSGLAVDATSVYWFASPASGSWSVMSSPKDGGTAVTLAAMVSPASELAVDSQSVYWLDAADGAVEFAVSSVPLGGGVPHTIATGAAPSGGGADLPGLVVSGGFLYWGGSSAANATTSVVMRVPIEGGTPATLATSSDGFGVTTLAVDGTNVYWASRAGAVESVPLAGGTPTLLAPCQPVVDSIAVDGTGLYWTNNGSTQGPGSVVRLTPK